MKTTEELRIERLNRDLLQYAIDRAKAYRKQGLEMFALMTEDIIKKYKGVS